MRIWHQGFIDLSTVPAYEPALRRHLAAVCRPDTEVVIHGMPPGSFEGTSPAQVARHAYLSGLYTNEIVSNAIVAEREGFDAMAIAIIQHIGLHESRSLVDLPVTNYGEAAIHLACQFGRRFAIVAFNRDLFDLLEENVRDYGLSGRMTPMQLMEIDYDQVARGFEDPEPLLRAFERAASAAIAAGADVLIPGQMIFAEILWQNGLHRVGDTPVMDALGACVKTAEILVDLKRSSGLSQARRGFWGARPPAAVVEAARRRYLRQGG